MNRILTFTLFFSYILNSNAQINRTLDGNGNNLIHPTWGSTHSDLKRMAPSGYEDGMNQMAGPDRPSARIISNELCNQTVLEPNQLNLSDFVWGWGQFLDHDLTFVESGNEFVPIEVPSCDPHFDPTCSGTVTIPFTRSFFNPNTGNTVNNPRAQVNTLTAYIDASGVYGVDQARLDYLRGPIDGKLKNSAGNLLPFNTFTNEFQLPVDNSAPFMLIETPGVPKFFVSGDIRANEQPVLASFHTLFMREHNRICDQLRFDHPFWSNDEIFHRARKYVNGFIQAITYEEFLPTIGVEIPDYIGYDNEVQAKIINTFSAAGYRFGHTSINGNIVRMEENGDTISYGNVALRDGFFNPLLLKDEGGIDPYFRGLAVQRHQKVDTKVIDDLRNFLFGPPGAGGFDLIAFNLQRGRDHGIPDYNSIRVSLGLPAVTNFNQISSDPVLVQKLNDLYGDVNNIDAWIGFNSEDNLPGSILGETLAELFKHQFEILRNGDRYYYDNDNQLTQEEKDMIRNTRLSDIILRNTDIDNIQSNVFVAQDRQTLSVNVFPFKGIGNIEVSAYPNPVASHFYLDLESKEAGKIAELKIFDLNGRLLFQDVSTLSLGSNHISVALPENLINGTYQVIVEVEGDQGQVLIVKSK